MRLFGGLKTAVENGDPGLTWADWKSSVLARRIFLVLGGMLLLILAGGVATLWSAQRIENLFQAALEKNVAALQAAEELQAALANQKGYVTYFFLDGNPEWLDQLKQYQGDFNHWLLAARQSASTDDEKKILDRVKSEYDVYNAERDQVIEFYKLGDRETGSKLHQKARERFFLIYDLCENYKQLSKRGIQEAATANREEARQLRAAAVAFMFSTGFLATILAYILATQVLTPIRELTRATGLSGATTFSKNEVTALSRRVHLLLSDREQTQTELERSRELLVHSEKMAVIGKLAAEIAHSIRNPMTSINMRLFSLERSLFLSTAQKEDFEVIAEEMRRLDNIVRNFLEYSRPHKLKMQKMEVSVIVDQTLQLLEKRLELDQVSVERVHQGFLPVIFGDPDLLKEVLVNLVVNACEAMEEGGHLAITEEETLVEPMGRAVAVRVSDTGPGVPREIQDRVLEPFYTTKEDGTGLGLSIALRIVEEHGGRLVLHNAEGGGAVFSILLPVKEE